MTKFTSLLPAFLRDRFKSLNRVILLMLIAIAMNGIFIWIQDGADAVGTGLVSATSFWSSLGFLVAFIRMAKYNEDVYQSNAIRLIPTSDTKIYLSNLSTTVIGFLYFMIVQAVLHVITDLIAGNHMASIMAQMFQGYGLSKAQSIGIILMSLLIMIAVIVMVWTTISLIHLIMLSIDAFLPIGRQRIIRGILYIIISLAIIRLGTAFFNIYGTVMNGLSLGWGTAFSLLGVLVLVAALEALANILLMNKFVETAQ